MNRLGMHFSLWAPVMDHRGGQRRRCPKRPRPGSSSSRFRCWSPKPSSVEEARALLDHHGIAPSASLCLPEDAQAHADPAAAEAFLMPALEVAHRLGCGFLGGRDLFRARLEIRRAADRERNTTTSPAPCARWRGARRTWGSPWGSSPATGTRPTF